MCKALITYLLLRYLAFVSRCSGSFICLFGLARSALWERLELIDLLRRVCGTAEGEPANDRNTRADVLARFGGNLGDSHRAQKPHQQASAGAKISVALLNQCAITRQSNPLHATIARLWVDCVFPSRIAGRV